MARLGLHCRLDECTLGVEYDTKLGIGSPLAVAAVDGVKDGGVRLRV